jgi:hypothetical protein
MTTTTGTVEHLDPEGPAQNPARPDAPVELEADAVVPLDGPA